VRRLGEYVVRWVLSYGSEAEVLEPEELRNFIREDLTASIDYYE
jgi:predicted DNA-binding transcriptional regulator YafY